MREDELPEADYPRVVASAVEVELAQQLSNLERVFEGCWHTVSGEEPHPKDKKTPRRGERNNTNPKS